jgi:hypothetical protein
MVAMDQYARRIVGFAARAGAPDGRTVCRTLARTIAGAGKLPRYLSTDHHPLFEFQHRKVNLRVLEIEGDEDRSLSPFIASHSGLSNNSHPTPSSPPLLCLGNHCFGGSPRTTLFQYRTASMCC